MQKHLTQLFKMEYGTRCDTFGCGEQGEFMVGRPDGPLNTSHVLCQVCTDSLVESIKEQFNLNAFAVPAPVEEKDDIVEYEIDEVLAEIKTHAALDELIEEFKLEGVPNRDEEGGKLNERKEAVRLTFK